MNSHWHPDHWSGNEVYAQEFPGLEIITTEQTREHMLNAANAWPPLFQKQLRQDEANFEKEVSTGKQSDGTPLTAEQRSHEEDYIRRRRDFTSEMLQVRRTYPTLTYVDKLTLYHGGREFRFISMIGDATGTTVLYLPKEKILLTGDLFAYPEPYFTPSLSQHARNLRMLKEFDADVMIPGHGPAWRDTNYLNREIELLESIVRQVHQAVQQGLVTVEEVQKAVNVDDLLVKFIDNDKNLRDFEKYLRLDIQLMVENAYREARDGEKFQY